MKGFVSVTMFITCLLLEIGITPSFAGPIPPVWNPDPNFPDFYQKDPNVNNGGCACAPVAATDSLFWLADKYNFPNLKTQGGATWQAVTNTLEGAAYMNTTNDNATYSGRFAAGKAKYISDAGYANQIVQLALLGGNGMPPTIDWIKQEVATGEDVEILIGAITDVAGGAASWDGGHYVAVTGYDQNNLKIADPWTNNNNNNENLPVTGSGNTTLNFDANGGAKPNYTQMYPRVNLQDGLFGGSQYDIIFAAVAESPAPEPGTLLLLGSALAILVGLRNRKLRRSS